MNASCVNSDDVACCLGLQIEAWHVPPYTDSPQGIIIGGTVIPTKDC